MNLEIGVTTLWGYFNQVIFFSDIASYWLATLKKLQNPLMILVANASINDM